MKEQIKLPQKCSLALLPAICILLQGCSVSSWSPSIKGSGAVVSETRAVNGFDRVALSGSGHLSIVQGDQEGLTIETDDNLVPLIKSEVVDGLLKIGPEHVNVRPTGQIKYELRLKNLKELHLSGSLEAEAQSLKTSRLVLTISGSGKIQLPRFEAGELEARISGSGDIEVAGKADQQQVHISGSGDYRAGECASQNTAIHISGSGDATVWASATLEAAVSGSGGINYYGTPQLNTHVSGSGSIHSLGRK
jgi:hypothetical protein